MTNNPASSLCARINGKNFEGMSASQDIQDVGTHSETNCSGGWAAYDQHHDSNRETRTIVGVVYFFANHSLWKTPIVNFPCHGYVDDKDDSTVWRLAVSGSGWTLGIGGDGSPTLFLNVMDNDSTMPGNMGINSKKRPTPVKLFGFTILPQRNDRVRTLIPYFTSKVCSSTLQRASKFQKLCPRDNRKTGVASDEKDGSKSEKKETVLVPADPEYYIEKDAATKASMRLCGVSFITPLSVSDEFAFVKNPTANSNNSTDTETQTCPPTCQNLGATCLRKSAYVETTGVNWPDSPLDKLDKNNTATTFQKYKLVAQSASVDEHVFSGASLTDAIKDISHKLSDREHSGNLTCLNEGNFTHSSGQLCNVVTSNLGCIVSSSICSGNSPQNYIPRTLSEGSLHLKAGLVKEMGDCGPNSDTAQLHLNKNNKFCSDLLSEPVKVNITSTCDSSVSNEVERTKIVRSGASNDFILSSPTETDLAKVTYNKTNDTYHMEAILRDRTIPPNRPPRSRPYSQTKFPLDIICSGKIGAIKRSNTFIGTPQTVPSVGTFSSLNIASGKPDKMFSTTRSFSAGKVELLNQITSMTKDKRESDCEVERDNCKHYSSLSDEVSKEEQFIDQKKIHDNRNNFHLLPNFNRDGAPVSFESAIGDDLLTSKATDNGNEDKFNCLLTTGNILRDMKQSNNESEICACDYEKYSHNESSEIDNVANPVPENAFVTFNLRNNSLDNFLKSFPTTGPELSNVSFNESVNTLVKASVSVKDRKCNVQDVLSSHEVKSPADDLVKSKIPDETNISKEVIPALDSGRDPVSALKKDTFIRSIPEPSHPVSGNKASTDHIWNVADETLETQTAKSQIYDAEYLSENLGVMAIPHDVGCQITSADISSNTVCLVPSQIVHPKMTNETGNGSETGNISTIVPSYATRQPNYIDTGPGKECTDKNPFEDIELTGKLPLNAIDESDKCITLIEQTMLEIFNWSQLPALVAKRENRLGSDSIKHRLHSSSDSSFINEQIDELVLRADLTDQTSSDDTDPSSTNEGNFNEESFNTPVAEADAGQYAERQIVTTPQLDSSSELFIDAICASELSSKDESIINDQSCDFDSSEFLDCVQPSFMRESDNDTILLDPEFNPNTEEFYSNSYRNRGLQRDFNDVHSYAIEENRNEDSTQMIHFSPHSSDMVWGFDQGPVASRRGQNVDEEWPSVWKPPEYESDQSGYETDEELDNMDEEMLRLEEKLKKFEEELGMSTDDSSESIHEEEGQLDLKKYFPLKSSYSTSHIDKAKLLEARKNKGKNDNVNKDCTAANDRTSSNDLFFLSGAGFNCGDRRCFSASLAQGSSQTDRNAPETSTDFLKNKDTLNEQTNSCNLRKAPENGDNLGEQKSGVVEEETFFSEFNLLDAFSDGHLWYEDGMTQIDFDNLCMVEDRISSDGIFFIFEDEILNDISHGDFPTDQYNVNEQMDTESMVDNRPRCFPSNSAGNELQPSSATENQYGFPLDNNAYSGIFLQENYLDTLPCIHGDCARPLSVHTTDREQRDYNIWHASSCQPTCSRVLPNTNVPVEYNRHTSLYENEPTRVVEPSSICDWQKMPPLSNNRNYVVDRSSTVGHVPDNIFRNISTAVEESIPADVDHNTAVCPTQDYFDEDFRYQLHNQPEIFDHAIIDTGGRSIGYYDSVTSEVPQDYELQTSTIYPKRPERTKRNVPSKQGPTSLGDECDDTITPGNNQLDYDKHQRARQARHSRHRRK